LIEGAAEGNLVILDSWPGQARTLFGDHDRFVDTYFKTFKGMYFTGDGARRDEEKSRAKERVYSFRDSKHRW
ncbi:hypothetical protein, partial [Acinetobacter nosocomialis]|uniref:hypothetical protein n=1 Tax=Acinetobacter nosocomialis TaxID=106654 RepID=UPI0013D061D5